MKLFIPIFLLVGIYACNKKETPQSTFSFINSTTVKVASKEKAIELALSEDDYFIALSDYEKSLLCGNELYNEFVEKQMLSCTENDLRRINYYFENIRQKLLGAGYNLNLPDTIFVVSSSCKEAGGAIAYTRESTIFVNVDELTERVFIHELYHIFEKYNPEVRDDLYALLGVNKCNEFTFPPEIRNSFITNPDSPILNHYITVTIEGKQEDVAFVLERMDGVDGIPLFESFTKKLILLEGDDNSKQIQMTNGTCKVFDFNDPSDLYSQIGNYTEYNVQPTEILAEIFTMSIDGTLVLTNDSKYEEIVSVFKNSNE